MAWPNSTSVPASGVRSMVWRSKRFSMRLLPAMYDLWQIGGSYAQRDVVTWTLTEAALRAGKHDIALALAHERLGARPRSAPNRRFLRQAEALAA